MRAFAVGAIVTDIEGTTSSIAFVKDVLFPYARARLRDFVARSEVSAILDEVRDLQRDASLANARADRRPAGKMDG
jgi:enolase-phosphatase E1